MLIEKLRRAKNKKGVTLVEMIAAIAITAILATVLSMMVVPVMNTYSSNRAKVALYDAATSRLNDIAMYLRGATGIYLSSYTMSYPDINTNSDHSVQFGAVRYFHIRCGIAMDDYYAQHGSPKVKNYLYPEFKVVDYSDVSAPTIDYASEYGMKLQSDDYQTKELLCPSKESLYFYVRQNPDDANRGNALEIHLTVKKGDVEYEVSKTIICENLVINEKEEEKIIHTAKFKWENNKYNREAATVSTGSDSSKWKKYYSVWFSKRGLE